MAVNDPDQGLRTFFEGHLPDVDERAFLSRLRERAETKQVRRSSQRGSASDWGRGHRTLILASVAAILLAALAITSVEVVRYMNRDQYVVVIGDGPMGSANGSGLYPVCVAGKWGYIDNTGAVKIEPQFDRAYDFSEGLARIAFINDGNSEQGYIDSSGEVVIRPRFAYAEDFSEGMAVVGEVDEAGNPTSCGYIDTAGDLVVPMRYLYALRFQEGLAVVGSQEGGAFFIDKTGATLYGPYELAMDFSEGLAYVKNGSRQGFIAENGDWALELDSGVLDMSSYLSSVFPFPASAAGFCDGLMALQSTSESSRPAIGDADKGYIDRTGTWVIRPQFNHACSFSEGLAAACLGEKWGYIDKTGTWVISPQFDYAQRFVEGLAIVGTRQNDRIRYGYIDTTGVLVVPTEYEQARDFRGGIAQVFGQSDTKIGSPSYIDRMGRVIWHAQ